METGEYLRTIEGQLSRHRWRTRRRLRIRVEGVEPRGKKMPRADKAEVQSQALKALQRMGRRAYRGPVALSMKFFTTSETPNYPQAITKNLLDLLSKPLSSSISRRKALLFQDDRQVQVLSVECQHGWAEPAIVLQAAPLRYFLDDLRLADAVLRDRHHEFDMLTPRGGEASLGQFNEILRNKEDYHRAVGARGFDALLRMARMEAQRELLGISRITVRDLATVFRVRGTESQRTARVGSDIAQLWETMFRATPIVLNLPELPQQRGTSASYKKLIEAEVDALKQRYSRLLDPLVIPVALQVIVKPASSPKRSGVTDLDNVVKRYLLPKVNEILAPPSSIFWTLASEDRERLRRLANVETTLPVARLPASTKRGVMRFEAWRVPRSGIEHEQGFVGAAVVADYPGTGDLFSRIDEAIDTCEKRH